MTIQQNIDLVRRLFEEGYNQENSAIFNEVFSPNIQMHDPAVANIKPGLQSLKQAEEVYSKAFPNKKTKVDDIFATEEKVVVRWTTTGTQKGELQGIAPTNKNIKITGISIYRFSNGKITEIWQNWDRLSLLEQIEEIQTAHALH